MMKLCGINLKKAEKLKRNQKKKRKRRGFRNCLRRIKPFCLNLKSWKNKIPTLQKRKKKKNSLESLKLRKILSKRMQDLTYQLTMLIPHI